MKQENKLATIIKKNISNPLFILGVAWMEKYDGSDGDEPQSGAGYVQEHGTGGEIWNFNKEGKYYYGYGATQLRAGVNLGKVVGGKNWQKGDEAKNIDVVFMATHPGGGPRIVGCYKNATVLHKHYGERAGKKEYVCWTEVENGFLVKEKDRAILPKEFFPRGIPQSQIMYLDTKPELAEYLRNYIYNYQSNKNAEKGGQENAVIDQEEKREIEINAVAAATKHYESKGYKVESVEKENCGWDLEVSKQREKTLQVEVKGHKGGDFNFELTHNEYAKMKEYSKTYRVFVARKALSDNPKTTIFSPYKEKGKWCLRDEAGKKLPLDEKTSAHAKPAG